MGTKRLFDAVRQKALACPNGRRPRIGIGVTHDSMALQASLQEGSQYAELLVVGTKIPGYSCQQITDSPEKVAEALTICAHQGEVDAIVRGQIDYSVYHRVVNRIYGFNRDLMCVSLMRSADGHEWLMTPMAHDHDASISGRCYLVKCAVNILEMLGVEAPTIAVLCADDELGYMPEVDRDFDDAVAIVARLQAAHLNAHVHPVRIETAMTDHDIVVPMNGILGNFVHRSLCYVGKVTLGGAFCLSTKLILIDTSRYADAFAIPIQSAAAVVNCGGLPVPEYMPGTLNDD